MQISTIEAKFVITYTYGGTKHQIIKLIPFLPLLHSNKVLNINMLITDLKINNIIEFQKKLHSIIGDKIRYINVSIIPIDKMEEGKKHVEQLQKAHKPDFQRNYNQLIQASHNKLKNQIVSKFLKIQRQWNAQQVDKIIEEHNFNDILELLTYNNFYLKEIQLRNFLSFLLEE